VRGEICDNSRRLAWNENVLNSTGPTFLSHALDAYNRSLIRHHVGDGDGGECGADRRGRDAVLVAPWHWFSPAVDPLHRRRFRTLCLLLGRRPGDGAAAGSRGAGVEGCDWLRENGARGGDSYTTHHWLHSWADDFPTGPRLNVTSQLDAAAYTRILV